MEEISTALNDLIKKIDQDKRDLGIVLAGVVDKQRQLEVKIAEVQRQTAERTVEVVMKRLADQDLLKKETPTVEEFDECLNQIDGILSKAFERFISDTGLYKIRFRSHLDSLSGDRSWTSIPPRVQERVHRSLEKLRHIRRSAVYYEQNTDPSKLVFKQYQRWVDLLSELVFWQECMMRERSFKAPDDEIQAASKLAEEEAQFSWE